MTTLLKQEADVRTINGTNFSTVYTGPSSNLKQVKLEIPGMNRTVRGKLFIKEFLGLTGMELSVNQLPPGAGVPFLHKHNENEECYIFTKGKGQMQVDGEIFDVEEGTIVRVSTDGSRSLRNNSDEDLHFICVQAKQNSLNKDTIEDGVRVDGQVVWE